LSYTHHDLLDSAALLGETALFAVLQRLKDFPHVILYLPTYRDDGGDFLAGACFDFYALNEMCKRLNAVFVVKWHLATNLHTDKYESGLRDLDNIVVLDPAVSDVMPIMSLSSILVTDYSSAMFDFLLLRRPIIRFCFDEDAYRSARDFYEAPIANLPGCKVMDFPQLLDSLQSTLASRQPEGGSEQILRQYNQNLDHDACFSVARFASNLD
jgi:CDP-glycerol glycerophosphotransferase (TagB/SpsB family)